MHHITALSHTVGRRLQVWRYPSRLCFARCGPRPVLRLNPPLKREQHDIAHSQAPPLLSRPQQDVQQPLPFVKEPQTPPQDAKVNTDENHAGPAQEVPQQGLQTAVADGWDAHPASLPFVCNECGSKFRSQKGVHDHHLYYGEAGRCKDSIPVARMKVNPHVLKFQDPRDMILTPGLGEKICEISSRELEPSPVPVSYSSGYQVISTFNAISRAAAPISVPGSPPFLRDLELPIDLHQAAVANIQPGVQKSDELNMLMLSAQATPPEFRYDEVDIVTHASLLLRLLKFCQNKNIGTRRISLRVIQGSLFVADDPLMKGAGGAENAALKSAIEDHCIERAPGLEHSSYYRSVQYSLGHIKCVVQRKVDALCGTLPGELPPSPSLSPVEPMVSRENQSQSEAAEIRLHREGRLSNRGLPIDSFWLSRTPVLLMACVTRDGRTLTEVRKIDLTAGMRQWEEYEAHQVALRKLATLLSKLKRAVKDTAPGGQECFGLIERHMDPPTIQLFLSEDESKVVSGDIHNNPSVEEISHGPEEASEGERQGPTGQANTSMQNIEKNYDGTAQ